MSTPEAPSIADYGFLSDCSSAALVDRGGSVDWWCVPRFDSPSLFGRLLGPDAGHWTLRPAADSAVEREYLEDSLVLRSVHTTAVGSVAVTDVPSVADTVAGWRSWAADHTAYDGAFPAEVRRSSVVLQGLTYAPSGAVVAAATTSLPETLGGTDNWDYRFAWLRDLSLTARALWLAACATEPDRLLDWVSTATGHLRDEPVQIAYGVGGERDLTERVLDHLPGYRGSRPVRVGNGAWDQRQLDVLGEVLHVAHLLRDDVEEFEPAVADLLVALADRAAAGWAEPDSGMWEARDAVRHYTSSKVLCWVALAGQADRAEALFRLAAGHANDLGLLAEEADPDTGAALGNVPQAFSHVGLVNAAWRLAHPGPVGG